MSNGAIFPVEENISRRLKLICEGDGRLVIERRYGLLFEEIGNLVFFLVILNFVCVILSFIFPLLLGMLLVIMNVIGENTMKESPFISVLFLILFFNFYIFCTLLYTTNYISK